MTIRGDPAPVIERLAGADMHRRPRLTGSAYSAAASFLPLGLVAECADRAAAAPAGYAGAADVAAVRNMAHALTMLDEQYGGAHGRGALLHYLTGDLSALCRAGFHNNNAGEQGLAQRYYLQSYRQGRESGVPGHDAYVLRTMTYTPSISSTRSTCCFWPTRHSTGPGPRR
ncbi:hypothetical protein ACIRST_37715 [Kitasatospora sp. NPDC101447]|uniref:hypothetical protein n=1 Tax=Kitasatospora sp. NPDC101447 TaxID=3364102 RepID=UPI00381C9FED